MGGMSSLGSRGAPDPVSQYNSNPPMRPLNPASTPMQTATDDESSALPLEARPQPAAVAFAESSSDPFTPQKKSPSAQLPFAMPLVVVANAAPMTGKKTVTRSVQIAGSNGSTAGSHNSRNGYDNRGLPIPDYPAESKRRHEQGLVTLDVEVKPDGEAGTIKVLDDAGFPRLADAAIAAVKAAKFDPALVDGIPVTGHIQIPFRFVP